MDWFARRHARGRPPHPDILTPAEWRVLDGVREGLQNTEIAERLGVSVNTVRTHVSSMLAKLELPDRHALAAWRGAPAPASTRALDRFGLLAPWLRIAASGAAIALAAGALWVALDGGRGGASGAGTEVTPAASAVEPASEDTRATRAPSGPPYLVEFAPGEEIDVWPAVVFFDPGTREADAWVFPDHIGEFGVAPDGSYIVWLHDDTHEVHLFRLDDQSDRILNGVEGLPLAYGPGGFLATTDGGFVLTAFDDRGVGLRDLLLGADSGPAAFLWTGNSIVAAVSCQARTCDSRHLSVHAWTTPPDGSIGTARTSPDLTSPVPPASEVSLDRSAEGARLAAVTSDAVRVWDETGTLLWEYEGEFYGNPRWSPDGAYLYVNAMPRNEADIAYVFSAEGEPLWRFVSLSSGSSHPFSYGFGCGRDVWLDDQHIGIGPYVVAIEAEVADLREPGAPNQFVRNLTPSPADLQIPLAAGVPWHPIHSGGDTLTFIDDGRYVFATVDIGHGGCATGLGAPTSLTEGLDFPPFDD